MTTFSTGFEIALLVSLPPGSNTAYCVALARNGARKAMPIILGAAVVDAGYALLAAAGIIAAHTLSITLTHALTAAFLVIAAALLWPRFAPDVSGQTAVGLAILNPATAALWFGLAPLVFTHHRDPAHVGLWVLGVAVGTATWFSGVALASARLHRFLTPEQQVWVQRGFAILLTVSAGLLVIGL
jgi:threonine/homoserine/homoserine lactone efflux protein